jgi:hypothetical protein
MREGAILTISYIDPNIEAIPNTWLAAVALDLCSCADHGGAKA